ncbi:hypothetical protein LWI29_021661 [Acer saccharum]|uniref:Uncharacterized protein n=1 Tax=Acer saccharum TaxID=4024 RepID=A0AA39VP26_ACESA|nr:hypothetical protein LWI29_021661 [Acer saccharum]
MDQVDASSPPLMDHVAPLDPFLCPRPHRRRRREYRPHPPLEFRCMHGRRSLGRRLHPPLEETSRVGRIVREFEEVPSQTLNMNDQKPRGEEQAPPTSEETQETPTNHGQRMTMGENSLPTIGNQPSPIVVDPIARRYQPRSMHINLYLPSLGS